MQDIFCIISGHINDNKYVKPLHENKMLLWQNNMDSAPWVSTLSYVRYPVQSIYNFQEDCKKYWIAPT